MHEKPSRATILTPSPPKKKSRKGPFEHGKSAQSNLVSAYSPIPPPEYTSPKKVKYFWVSRFPLGYFHSKSTSFSRKVSSINEPNLDMLVLRHARYKNTFETKITDSSFFIVIWWVRFLYYFKKDQSVCVQIFGWKWVSFCKLNVPIWVRVCLRLAKD